MPVDIKLSWDNVDGTAFWSFANNDLATDTSLLTPIIVSLFTDARANDDDQLPDDRDTDRRGWWGDLTNEAKPNDHIGSKLWLLERSKATRKNLIAAEQYIRESLQWLIDEKFVDKDGIAVQVEAQSYQAGTTILAFHISLRKPNGGKETYKFETEWNASLALSNVK